MGHGDGVAKVSILSGVLPAGKFLGKAFDVPRNMLGEIFFAAVVLKVGQTRLLTTCVVVCVQVATYVPCVMVQNAEMKFNFGDSPLQHLPKEVCGCGLLVPWLIITLQEKYKPTAVESSF